MELRKKIKRGDSTVIWKWKWGYKSAPENDFPIEIGNSETGFGRMMPSYAQIRSRNRFPVSGSRFPVRICVHIFISRHLRLIFFLSPWLGPARPVHFAARPGPARPVEICCRPGPARPVESRRGPARPGPCEYGPRPELGPGRAHGPARPAAPPASESIIFGGARGGILLDFALPGPLIGRLTPRDRFNRFNLPVSQEPTLRVPGLPGL